MVATHRTPIYIAIAAMATACGVVLPPADDDGLGNEPRTKDPVTTKGAAMPAPNGSDGDAGVAVNGAPGEGGGPSQPGSREYVVFVTSSAWSSDEIGGIAGADSKCAKLANVVASLAGKKWAAWLSNGATSALARVGGTPGPWSRVDGVKVAQDRNQLVHVSVPLLASIAADERGSLHGDLVWTGTSSDGSAATNVCSGWTSTDGRGVYGRIDHQKPTWTSTGEIECNGSGDAWSGGDRGGGGGGRDPDSWSAPRHRLYCFEID